MQQMEYGLLKCDGPARGGGSRNYTNSSYGLKREVGVYVVVVKIFNGWKDS